MKRFLFVAMLVMSIAATAELAFAQPPNQDPFSPGGKPNDENPFGGPLPTAKDSPPMSDEDRLQIESEKMRRIQMELQDCLHQRNAYLQRVNQLEAAAQAMQRRVDAKAMVHDELIKALITSSDEGHRQTGLNYLVKFSKLANTNDFADISLDAETINTLDNLADSKDKLTCQLAVESLIAYDDDAIKRGFQTSSNHWKPVPNFSPKAQHIRDTLDMEADFIFDETPLSEIVEMLSQNYRMEIVPAQTIDANMPITIDLKDQTLASGLTTMLSKYDLAYRVTESHLALVHEADSDNKTSLTFNIRGLLTETMDVMKMMRVIESRFASEPERITFEAIDKHRLVASGTEHQLRQVSQLLATLAKN